MANVLSREKQVAVISALAEGASIRSIERMTNIHRDTIMRLGIRIGQGCVGVLDRKMQGLSCQQLLFVEVWGFIGKKQRHLGLDDSAELGDVWTFCAIDAETKLVPAFRVGKRDAQTAQAFVRDVAARLKGRVQISTDGLRSYVDAVDKAFGCDLDFAQIIKTYDHDHAQHPERKYSAPQMVSSEKIHIMGQPDMELCSTSYVERLNATNAASYQAAESAHSGFQQEA